VDNDAGLQVAIPVRSGSIPNVHPTTTVLTIRWGHEVGVIVTAAILSISNDSIIFLATSAEVVLLEVTRLLIKTVTGCVVSCVLPLVKRIDIPIVEIVNHVGGIEQLGDGGVDEPLSLLQSILTRSELGVVSIVELEVLATVRSVVGEVAISTLPVLMSEDVVAPGNGSVADRGTVLETLVGRVRVISDGQRVPAQRTGEFVVVLCFDGAVAFTWIVDTPLEDIVGRGALFLPGNRSMGIGGPVDDRDDLVRRVSRDRSLIPVVLHLDLELPDEVEVGGVTIRDLNVGQTSLDRVDGIGDVVDELYRDIGFTANKVTVHIRGHAIDIVVILGKDILNHVVLGGSGNHELEERVTWIFQFMILGNETGRKVGKGAS